MDVAGTPHTAPSLMQGTAYAPIQQRTKLSQRLKMHIGELNLWPSPPHPQLKSAQNGLCIASSSNITQSALISNTIQDGRGISRETKGCSSIPSRSQTEDYAENIDVPLQSLPFAQRQSPNLLLSTQLKEVHCCLYLGVSTMRHLHWPHWNCGSDFCKCHCSLT